MPSLKQMPVKPEWLKVQARSIGTEGAPRVDRQNNVILGYVVAQQGPFKSEGRGEFDGKALRTIVKLMKAEPTGLKSRFTHPDLSSDGLGKFLGRAKNPRLDVITTKDADGNEVQIEAI